ncbi:MAG: NUDIX domain-containing protein [Streptosporangiales bacterium]|nr:NUDIX domain-containing protein [Streptosporangiales bacterium]
MVTATSPLADTLADYRPHGDTELADVARLRELVRSTADPWDTTTPLHVTASALIVHPPTRRVLLRWHERQQAWLQVGGHGDPGETDPLEIALREGHEEAGLTDLVPWPQPQVLHITVVPVVARGDEPAHEHADVRYVFATDRPDDVRPEKPNAPLRWLSLPDARAATTEPNVQESLTRLDTLLADR